MKLAVSDMRLVGEKGQDVKSEMDVLAELLPWQQAHVLELGCGRAEKTRQIVDTFAGTRMTAAEVDPHAYNYNLNHPHPGVEFVHYGAEAIDAPDTTFDLVLMFKSLHHVPGESLDTAMAEIHRVLKPGGLAYISEPVFEGDLNEVIRMFHDEEVVRQQAFAATQRAIDTAGLFTLQREYFFLSPVIIPTFEHFERGVINTTHSEHNLDDTLMGQVRAKFLSFAKPGQSGFYFETPNRVDVLRRVN